MAGVASAHTLLLLVLLPLVLSVPAEVEESSSDAVGYAYENGDVRNCPTRSPHNKQPLYRMGVLPGAGFDNLRNVDRGRVFEFNYSHCRVSEDGRYLLPDSVFLVPIKESRFESFAEYFDHWDNYSSMTASSINVEGGVTFVPINGKFSREYRMVKSHQIHDDAKTTRVQMRYNLYKVMLHVDSPLHPTFKARLFDIASNLQNNNSEYAHYLAEILVRDYGTHYLTSMDAGAIFALVDHVSSTYVNNLKHDTTKIAASASANFFGRFSIGSDYSRTTSREEEDSYLQQRTHSEVFAIGGPPYTSHLTVEEWELGVANNLVAIDRSGNPLHFAITPATLPEIPEITVRDVADAVYEAVATYYEVNSHQGCIDPGSPNFYFQANVNDESCDPPKTNFTFGGVYQTCHSTTRKNDFCFGNAFGMAHPLAQTNPLTGGYSCPSGYTAILLYEGKVKRPTAETVCRKKCKSCWLFARCCSTQCVNEVYVYEATYHTYWCAALDQVPANSGYLFGGVYTQTAANQVTGAMNCPVYYLPLRIGRDIKVCVSDDYELGFAHSVNFAGFESCEHGNPLAISRNSPEFKAKMWPHSCPRGYAQHLVSVEDGCSINYCVQAGSFFRGPLIPAILPPFERSPYYNRNDTGVQVIVGAGGNIWAKLQDNNWKELTDEEAENVLYKYWKGTGSGKENAVSGQHSGSDDRGEDAGSDGYADNYDYAWYGDFWDSSGSGIGNSVSSSPRGAANSHSEGIFGDLSKEAVSGVSAAATLFLCTLIALVVFMGYCIKKKRQNRKEMGEELLLRETSHSDDPQSHYCRVNCDHQH